MGLRRVVHDAHGPASDPEPDPTPPDYRDTRHGPKSQTRRRRPPQHAASPGFAISVASGARAASAAGSADAVERSHPPRRVRSPLRICRAALPHRKRRMPSASRRHPSAEAGTSEAGMSGSRGCHAGPCASWTTRRSPMDGFMRPRHGTTREPGVSAERLRAAIEVQGERIEICSSACDDMKRASDTAAGRTRAADAPVRLQSRVPAHGESMFPANQTIAGFDPELAAALDHERVRQEDHIELIASENYASPRVLEAQGSVLTNKYAEGLPGQALLRRLRIRRRRRATGDRPRQKTVQGRLRQCPAALRFAGQRRGVPRADQAR